MADDEPNLSGVWKGIFHYPRHYPPVPFDAEIRDHFGALSGETVEVANAGGLNGQTLHAVLWGNRQGSDVSFAKSYDTLRRAPNVVHYQGQVNESGDEISGTWRIAGSWSGPFMMIRKKPEIAAAKRTIAATV